MIHVEPKIRFIEMIDISVLFRSLPVGISRLRPKNDHKYPNTYIPQLYRTHTMTMLGDTFKMHLKRGWQSLSQTLKPQFWLKAAKHSSSSVALWKWGKSPSSGGHPSVPGRVAWWTERHGFMTSLIPSGSSSTSKQATQSWMPLWSPKLHLWDPPMCLGWEHHPPLNQVLACPDTGAPVQHLSAIDRCILFPKWQVVPGTGRDTSQRPEPEAPGKRLLVGGTEAKDLKFREEGGSSGVEQKVSRTRPQSPVSFLKELFSKV